jgi:ABC-2 type transport system ATP-binding protein
MRHLTRTTIEAETARPVSGLESLSGIHNLQVTDGRVRFAVDGEHLDDAVRALSQFGIQSLTSHPPTLEELMLRHYGDERAAKGNGNGARR